MSDYEIVRKINSHYVRDDCVQVMIPYKKCITVVDESGIMYHAKNGSSLYINKYLKDDRKYWFPYSNIPVHYSKLGMFNKCWYTNQILDFEKPYIRILDGKIIESFVVKDTDGALIINKNLSGNKRSEFMSREDLEIFLGNSNLCSKDTYFIFLDGSVMSVMLDENYEIAHGYEITSEDIIFEYVKERLEKNVADLKKYINENPRSTVGSYFCDNPYFLKFVEKQVNNFNDIDFPVGINPNNVPFLMVNTNGDNISIHKISIYFIGHDKYRVDIVDIPIFKYTLEQLKYVSKIGVMREPKIPLRLNPGVTKEDKNLAKKRIKSIRNNLIQKEEI